MLRQRSDFQDRRPRPTSKTDTGDKKIPVFNQALMLPSWPSQSIIVSADKFDVEFLFDVRRKTTNKDKLLMKRSCFSNVVNFCP